MAAYLTRPTPACQDSSFREDGRSKVPGGTNK
jgi:hypothetical protein